MKYLVFFISFFIIFSNQATAQSIPKIYLGDKDSPCGGAEVYRLYQSCDNGNTADCDKMEEKRKWILENCKGDGNEKSDRESVIKNLLDTEDTSKKKDNGGNVIEKGTDPGCYLWGVKGDPSSGSVIFKYCNIESRENKCYYASNCSQPLGINISADKMQSGFFYKAVISRTISQGNNKDKMPYDYWNEYASWADSKTDATTKFTFSIVTKSNDGIWITDNKGSRKIPGLGATHFTEDASSILEKIAVINFFDKNCQVIRPFEKNINKIILSGNYLGGPYIIGINAGGYTFKPLALQDNASTQRLYRIMVHGSVIRSPLKDLLDDWYYKDSSNYIIACVEGGRPAKYPNPEAAWQSGVGQFSGSNTTNLSFILSNGQVIGNSFGKIEAPWYQRVMRYNNAYLAMLAVADPYCTFLGAQSDRVILMTGDPDNLYAIPVNKTGNLVKAVPLIVPTADNLNYRKKEANKCKEIPGYYEKTYGDVAREIKLQN